MNWLKYRKIYFLLSGTMIAVGVFSLLKWGLKLGVDFTGGTIAEYAFNEQISTEEVTRELEDSGLQVSAVQVTDDGHYFFRMPPVGQEDKDKLNEVLTQVNKGAEPDEIRFETVGPSIGPELVKKTYYAIAIAAGAILLWVAIQFKSLKFGASAVIAMFHDSFILIGSYSLLGHFFGAEVDFLFVTALLTTLSFSVHDTIVVYDRIRESQREMDEDMVFLADKAITETMVRSLNNSFTILFMLLALVLLGGTTVRWFAVALLIGTILGTYSSPFVAVPLLVTWDDLGHIIGPIGGKLKNLKGKK